MKIPLFKITPLVLCLGLATSLAFSQVQPTGFVLGTLPVLPSSSEYFISGYGPNSGSNYYTDRAYHLYYGKTDVLNDGFNRIVKLFSVEGESYSLTKAVAGAVPYMKVAVNRHGISPDEKVTALFEVAVQPSNADGSDMYLTPDYVGDMEVLINSYVINRGTDNVFVRSSGVSTNNNITRIDLILEEPIIIPATLEGRKKSGFLLMERGGNDNFKIAAITGLAEADTTATEFGSLVSVSSDDWGGTGQDILSVVMQKEESDEDLKPSQFIASQEISGVFISLDDLDLAAGITIYGISLMANNATDPEDFPDTVPDSDGGLDFMAGGGFFTRAVLVEGSIWNDADGDAEIADAAGEPGVDNGLWANLVDHTGRVISSVPVHPDGSYSLFIAETNVEPATLYAVVLTNNEYYEDDIISSADLPANGYQYTGTNYEGVADNTNHTGMIELGTITEDISGVNFGIQRPPVADPKEFTVGNSAFSSTPPAGYPSLSDYQSIPLSSAELTGYPTGGSLSGSDPEDCPGVSGCSTGMTFNIETINANTKIYYDFGDGIPVEIDVTAGPVVIEDFDVAKMLVYGAESSGTSGDEFGFTYSITDKAGITSDPVGYTITVDEPLPVSLAYFEISKMDDKVLLTWSTYSEHDNQGFEVERSHDSRVWSRIGWTNTQAIEGNSNQELRYSFTDNTPMEGNNFYRLKQVDINGKCEYSVTRVIQFGTRNQIFVIPNPASGTIMISGISKGKNQIVLVNAIGQTLFDINLKDEKEYRVDLTSFVSGIYYISIRNEDGTVSAHKVIKQ